MMAVDLSWLVVAVNTNTHTRTHIDTDTHIDTHAHTYAPAHVWSHARTHAHAHTHTQTHYKYDRHASRLTTCSTCQSLHCQTFADINECEDKTVATCSHDCTNKPGTFQCSCPVGMRLDNDQHNCLRKNKNDRIGTIIMGTWTG